MKLFRKLFSIRNDAPTRKTITILGIRIKLRRPLEDACHYHHLPIERKKIVFRSVLSGYGCNPKYIVEEILRRKLPYDLVWIVDKYILKYIKEFPEGVRLVMFGTPEAMQELATAHIWVTNGWLLPFVRKGLFKREGQVYIQTWHGALGFKKLNWEAAHPGKTNQILLQHDMQQMDYLISNATWETELFKDAFKHSTARILELGHAKNDVLFGERQASLRRRVYERLGIADDVRLLLYAPTWRENKDFSCFTLDYEALLSAVEQRFGGEWQLAARWHPAHDRAYKDQFLPSGAPVLNVSDYPDMQELLAAVDILVTDYSSCILDFMFTGRPGFIYAPDYRNYEQSRGLCYPLEEAPFPVAEDNAAMQYNVVNFNMQAYEEKVKAFLAAKGCMEDGHAAERVTDLITHIISEDSTPYTTL